MKKALFTLFTCVCLLLAISFILPGTPVSAASKRSALAGASLYLDDQADVVFCFDPAVIQQRKAGGTAFSFSVSYGEKNLSFTESDLERMKDQTSGAVYQTITVGPFMASELNTKISYQGSMTETADFSLKSLAVTGVSAYEKMSGTDNQRTANLLKSFANYAVAADNIANKKAAALPYTGVTGTATGFTANPQTDMLGATRELTGRYFVINEDVYLRYTGTLSSASESISGWKVTVNAVDITSTCNLAKDGSTFSFTVPISAENAQEKLRIIVRNSSGTALYDAIDRADAVAEQLSAVAGYEALSAPLTAYLQATSDYSTNPVLDPNRKYESGKYYAGFGRADITPYCEATLLNDKDEIITSTEFLEGIYASCVALRDTKKEPTVTLIFSIDVRNIQDFLVVGAGNPYSKIKTNVKNAAAAAGITLTDDQIFFNATHNHNAPTVTFKNRNQSVIDWYNNHFYPGITEAAKKAIQDMAVIEGAYTGVAETAAGTNYNRRYVYDGTTVVGYEDAQNGDKGRDREMRTIRFDREGAKDILLVNWQAHAANTFAYDKGHSDFVGTLRTRVEKEQNAYLLYINGASGDLNMTRHTNNKPNLDPGESGAQDAMEGTYIYEKIGNSLADTVDTILDNETAVALGDIKIDAASTNSNTNNISTTITDETGRLILPYRKHADGTYCTSINVYGSAIVCDECEGIYQAMGKAGAYNKTGSIEYNGKTYTYKAYTYDSETFSLAYSQHSQYANNTNEFKLWTMTMGDKIGFAFAPYEMFNRNGKNIRAAAKTAAGDDATIFTAGYTNGYLSYIATEAAFEKAENRARGDDGTGEVGATKYLKGCAEYFETILSNSLKKQFAN